MAESAVFRLVEGKGYSLEEQLALLAEVSQGFASSLDINETLELAVNRFMDYLDAEAASIFLLEEPGEEGTQAVLVCHRCAGPVDISGLRLPLGSGIVGQSVLSRECRMVRDVRSDPDFAHAVDEGSGFETRSVLCVPLLVQERTIGAIELINKRGGDGLFDEPDRHLVVALAAAAAMGVNSARMAEALVEKERLEKELELAREIQRDLLPSTAEPGFPVTGISIPVWEVSGDFYDFMQLPDGRIYFNLADVAGKGMNAALLMAKTSSLLHCMAKTTSSLGTLMRVVNREICETASRGMFVTVVSGFIEPGLRRVTLANAGHPPALLHRCDGTFEEFPAAGPPLGILGEAVFPTVQFELDGGSLYMFSDGVTESLTDRSEPLDVVGFKELVRSASALSATSRLEDIVAEIRRPGVEQRDDITLMLIEASADVSASSHGASRSGDG